MTIKELHLKLQELDIKKDSYFLHGLFGNTNDDEKLSMRIYRDKYSIIYEIYYKEKSNISILAKFNKEDEACGYFYNKIIKS